MWSESICRAIGSSKKAKIINNHIEQTITDIYNHYRSLALENKEITATSIKNAWKGVEEKPKMLIDVFEEHNENVKNLIGIDFANNTYQRYVVTLSHIKEFIKKQYGIDDMPIKDVDYKFIADFELHLKISRKCSHNTATKYVKNFKKITRIAIAHDWIKVDPFVNHKFKFEKVDRGFLAETELEIIRKKHFKIERLENVKDVFLFACYTGLAYSDLKSLNNENLINKENGSNWIYTKRTKTGNACHIPLIEAAIDVLNKYKHHPFCKINVSYYVNSLS